MEIIPVILVVAIAGMLWIYAVVQKHLATPDPQGDLERLRRRVAWLQERLETARRENWEVDMISPILRDLVNTNGELEHVRVHHPRR